MLTWHPRLAPLLVVVALVAVAIANGLIQPFNFGW